MIKSFLSFLADSELRSTRNRFYVSLEADRKGLLDALLARELPGVQGISATADNINQFFTNKKSLLVVLDQQATIAENTLEEVRYDDLDYLCSRNMAPMVRITGTHNLSICLGFVLSWFPTALRTKEIERLIREEMHQHTVALTLPDIETFEEFLQHVVATYSVQDEATLRQGILQAIETGIETCREEEEWLVHGTLHLPVGTKLYVAERYAPMIPYLNQLRAHYPVKIIRDQTMQRIQPHLKRF